MQTSMLKAGRPSRKDKAIASVLRTDEIMRINFNAPKETHKELKQRALEEEITITELILKAVKLYLSK